MHFSALLIQRRLKSNNGNPLWEDTAAPIRIPTITQVSYTQEDPGGFTDGSFTIPPEHVRFDPEDLQFNTTVWLLDGGEKVFHGHILKATPQLSGEVQVTCNGSYRKLDSTRMRVAWSDQDLSEWNPSSRNLGAAQVQITSDGRLSLKIPKGTQVNVDDSVHVDYLLFDEAVGPRDLKLVTGLSFDQATINLGDGFEFRIYGRDTPGDDQPDLLFSSQNTNPISRGLVSDGSSGDDPNGWPSQVGYRCLSIGLWATNSGTTTDDRGVSFGTIHASNTARRIKLLTRHQTSTLIKDIWAGAGNGYDIHHLLQEEYQGTTGEAIVGAIPPSGQYVSGLSFDDWVAPREIIETLADVSGYQTGMRFPTTQYRLGSHVTPGSLSRNTWYRQPAMLYHEPYPPVHQPDYYVRLQRGAQWQPDGAGDDITEATYVTYSNTKGRQVSVFVEDTSQDNWLNQQGWHEASDWQITPPVGDETASSLAGQYNASKQQPTLSGMLTLTGDTIGAITGPGGERITKLSTLRVGTVVRVIDAKGPKAGRVTKVVYTGRSVNGPETVQLTINSPLGQRLKRRLARLALRDAQQRSR